MIHRCSLCEQTGFVLAYRLCDGGIYNQYAFKCTCGQGGYASKSIPYWGKADLNIFLLRKPEPPKIVEPPKEEIIEVDDCPF